MDQPETRTGIAFSGWSTSPLPLLLFKKNNKRKRTKRKSRPKRKKKKTQKESERGPAGEDDSVCFRTKTTEKKQAKKKRKRKNRKEARPAGVVFSPTFAVKKKKWMKGKDNRCCIDLLSVSVLTPYTIESIG